MITRGPDRLTQQATTDSAGNYRSRFEEGTGDYLVYVSATGFKAERRRVQRQGDERELVANFALARDLTMLAAVKVTALRPERASNQVRPSDPEPGSGDKWKDGVDGQISPSVVGDLNALAGTMPNVTMTPAGASILGSGASRTSPRSTEWGWPRGAFRARRVPRRASRARRSTRRAAASRAPTSTCGSVRAIGFYQRRNAFITFDPPSLQFTDPVSRALGTTSGGFRGSVGADGELIRRVLTYNVALDVSRAASDPSTLVSADADALLRAGVAPDSVARLIAIADAARHPARRQQCPVRSRAIGDHVARAARRHA